MSRLSRPARAVLAAVLGLSVAGAVALVAFMQHPGGGATGAGSGPGAAVRRSVVVLPAAIVAEYWRADGSPRLTTASRRINVFFLAFATSARPGTGEVAFAPDQGGGVTPAQLRADIASVHARGAAVLLSIGGQIDGGITLHTPAQVSEMVASVNAICDQYGCDGIDWDIEHGGAGADLTSLVAASAQLKALRGSSFAITATAEPGLALYEDFAVAAGQASVAGATYAGGVCDLYSPQFYDYPATISARQADIVATAQRMLSRGLPPSRFQMGSTYAGSSIGRRGEMPVAAFLDAYRSLLKSGLRIRGASLWDMTVDARTSYPFAVTFGQALGT